MIPRLLYMKTGTAFRRPNIVSISHSVVGVNKDLAEIQLFCVLYDGYIVFLFTIPSCIPTPAAVSYQYKGYGPSLHLPMK